LDIVFCDEGVGVPDAVGVCGGGIGVERDAAIAGKRCEDDAVGQRELAVADCEGSEELGGGAAWCVFL
jgi:hypothetical protein